MLLSLATQIFGTSNERAVRRMQKDVAVINALEEGFKALTDDELRAKTQEFRDRLSKGEKLDNLTAEAFATVREASRRVMNMRHFDVQLIGGMVLHKGQIAEMRTGEGKTLVATLAVYLNALEGKGVHVVTVNDYLAKRDAEWMGKLYNFLGLSVGIIVANIPDFERRNAYQADITYGTNNEFGFDYLRDNMKYALEDMVQRPFNFAIVDEVDSILIDEARTPLIISGPSETATDLYVKVDQVIPPLSEEHYEKDEKARSVTLTEAGVERVEELLREFNIMETGALYDVQNMTLVHHVTQALRAHKLFSRDTDYIVRDDKVIIIDEFTGRMMEGRRFSEGLHQALEAKEGVKIQNENQTLASITFQNYFRLYPKLAGMTGTGMTEAGEFMEIYNLSVVDIPTNLPVSRIDHNDKIYKSVADKDQAIIELVRECQQRKQPVLVGTVSIEKSEQLSSALKAAKVKHQVLNARHHEQESQIIAQAGQPAAVTIATNMAGRGTDIKLGGNLDMLIEQHVPQDVTPEERKALIKKLTDQYESDAETVRKAGGLYVIGTERHESRRIDNQLRGRSGRQGDPGASMFFLSAQDDLMRIFSPDTLQAVLSSKSLGLKDGEALEHPMLSKALQRAQARVEAHNFEIRKTLLKFDNIMNDQRKVIYEQRRDIMNAPNVRELVDEMRSEIIAMLVQRAIPQNAFAEQWDSKTLKMETHRLLNLDLPIEEWVKEDGIAEDEIHDRIQQASDRYMADKIARTGGDLFAEFEKTMLLQMLDQHWKDHLLNMDYLRTGINLRAFGQRDPLNEFRMEAFNFFESMLDGLRESMVENVSRVEIKLDESALARMIEEQRRAEMAGIQELHETFNPGAGDEVREMEQEQKVVPIRKTFDQNDPSTWDTTPRNAPCPCGSGKKYKQCHGRLTE